MQNLERQDLLVMRQMLLEASNGHVPLEERGLILEVQERPKLKTWVRNGELDSMRLGLLARVSQLRVFVGIEYAPDFVVAKEPISLQSSFAVGIPLPSHSALDQNLGIRTARLDLHLYDGAKFHA